MNSESVDYMNSDNILIISGVLNDAVTKDEYGVSLAQKWQHIRAVLGVPELNIMTNFESKSFEEVYKSIDGAVLDAYIFAAQLRMIIFDDMLEHNENKADEVHLKKCGETAYVWFNKLFDKREALESNEPIKHLWLN